MKVEGVDVDEVGSALRYMRQVQADDSMQYAAKHAHDHMMHIALKSENDRLRFLLKSVERRGSAHRCPFEACNAWDDQPHDTDCPAFTPSGELK